MNQAQSHEADNSYEYDWNSYRVLELVVKAQKTLSDDQAIALSLNHLRDGRFNSFTVQMHLSLLYMKRVGHEVDDLITRSWIALTGMPCPQGILPRLPKSVLDRECTETVTFYEAAYYPSRQQGIFSKVPQGECWLSTVASRVTESSFWTPGMGAFALLACTALMIPLGRQLLLGGLVGLTEASLVEFFSHLALCHASSRLALKFRGMGTVGLFIEEINLAHKVHHFKTQTDFRSDFSDELTRNRVEAYLEQRALAIASGRVEAGIYPREQMKKEAARIVREIQTANYGVDGTITGVVAMNIFGIPLYVVNILLFLHFGGVAFLVTSCLLLGSLVGLSMYSHRYLHMTNADVDQATRLGTTTALMRWYRKTPVASLQARRHYRHHQDAFEYSKAVNGVVMSFSTADFLMRRGVQEADIKHLLKMRKEGFTR